MSRFLFVVLPLDGHVNPAVAVAQALTDQGHEVAWVGPETYLRPRVGPEATVHPTGMRPYRGAHDRGTRAIKSLWDSFVTPFARFMLPGVDRAVTKSQPDVLVADQHAIAGPLVARRHGLPWATLCPGLMELTRPLRTLPKVDAWVDGQLAKLAAHAGLPPGGDLDPRFSPDLTIAFTTTALTGSAPLPDRVALVGPALGHRPPMPDFRWEAMDPARRTVLVTMGTLAQDLAEDFYRRMVAALLPASDRLQAIVVAPPEALPEPPAHIQVARRVPITELMPHLAAVVCHGGANTVGESLTHGVPLVIAPIRHDQPVIAEQVVAAGAGVRVSFSRARPERLRTALTAVLDDPAYRTAARRVGDSFAAAGGAQAAATHLATLAEA